jgi:hypothetical protein
MAGQDANNVAITGGAIDGTTVGATTPTTGAFTYANFPSQSVAPATPSTGFTQYAASTGMFSWKGTNGFIRQFDASGITADRTWVLPNTAGTIALTSNLGTIASQNSNAVTITGGSIDGTTVGATTASTGAFTTLSASSTVSGAGFDTYLASPPAIGGTTASTGRFTTITSTIATGTAPFTVASTTAVANLSIGGNAGTVTNGVYTTDTGTVTNTMLAGSITNAKLVNSSITFGSTAQALGSTVSGISGVTIDNGIIGGTAAAAGTFTTLTATGQTSLGGIAGSESLRVLTPVSTGGYLQVQSTSATQSSIQTVGSANDYNFGISAKGTGSIRFFTAALATEQFRVSHTASAVNYVQVTGATTASKVVAISAQGSDTDVTLSLSPKGAGTIRFGTYTGTILTPTGYITITDSGGTTRRLLVG